MIKRFITYYKPYKHLFLLDILSAILIASIDLITPRFTNYLISSIIPEQKFQRLIGWLLILGMFFIVRVLLQYVVEYWGHVLGVRMERDMRNDLFNHIQGLPIQYFDRMKVGKLMSRLVNDLNDISEVAHHGPEDLLISIVLLVGSFYMMYTSNLELAIVMTILVPLMIFIGVRQNLKFRKAFRVMRERLAEINARVESNFSGIRVVKAFTAEENESEDFALGNARFLVSRQGALKVMAEFGVTVKFFVMLITWMVLFVGGYLVIQNRMTVGSLVEFILYVQLFQQPITKISAFIMMYNQAMAGFERFIEIMEISKQKDHENATILSDVKGEIIFDHVSFQYDEEGDKHVLKDLSLSIKAGTKVAFVGPSGGGKSTLCSLIPRFYELSDGRILIDGKDIQEIQLNSLRQHIGIVQQDVFIFGGTILQNIRYGKFDASEEEVMEAAKQAQAWDFIEQLDEGIHTQIGERGVTLSGGQRQRIALARVFLKNPKILIFDEATSALDNQTEKEIQKTLNELSKDRTSLIVAHRLSTIKDADWIYVLTPHGIVEEGRHQDLMSLEGVYYQLYTKESIYHESKGNIF